MFALLYTKAIGAIFTLIAGIMLAAPAVNLAQDGIMFDSFTVAGKAEIRAYYVGTALCVAWTCFTAELKIALQFIALLLGGFASSRVVGYSVDGIDENEGFKLHQHTVFIVEAVGCLYALILLTTFASKKEKKK